MLPNPLTADVVARILGPHSVTVLDVGARYGASTAWWRLPALAKLVGFDPSAEECESLRQAVVPGQQEQYVPVGLGRRTGARRLFMTKEPGCSSIHRPHAELIERFPVLSCMTVVNEQEIDVTTLDAWAEQTGTADIRFIKLDTQGSELEILRGAERVLADCVGLEVEVEFSELYEGQPLFADVDQFLRQQGFMLWRLGDLCHYAEATSPVKTGHERAYYGGLDTLTEAGNGRLFWGNAVYFRDYAKFGASQENVRRVLILACLLSARGDLSAAAACLRRILDWGAPGLPTHLIDELRLASSAISEQLIPPA